MCDFWNHSNFADDFVSISNSVNSKINIFGSHEHRHAAKLLKCHLIHFIHSNCTKPSRQTRSNFFCHLFLFSRVYNGLIQCLVKCQMRSSMYPIQHEHERVAIVSKIHTCDDSQYSRVICLRRMYSNWLHLLFLQRHIHMCIVQQIHIFVIFQVKVM